MTDDTTDNGYGDGLVVMIAALFVQTNGAYFGLDGKFDKRPRVGKAVAPATPVAFRDLLLAIARSVPQNADETR